MEEEKLIIQISSGQGPAECELAVGKLLESLKIEYPDIEVLSEHRSRFTDGLTSVMFETEFDLSKLEGSVQWICKSPLRPNHKRKNWFVDVSVISEVEEICRDEDMRIEKFHSGGKGGQNVNKVETGVRVIHIPTGITVESTAERSQYQNKRRCLAKLNAILNDRERMAKGKQKNDAWREHTRIVRGNPVRVYEGLAFKKRK